MPITVPIADSREPFTQQLGNDRGDGNSRFPTRPRRSQPNVYKHHAELAEAASPHPISRTASSIPNPQEPKGAMVTGEADKSRNPPSRRYSIIRGTTQIAQVTRARKSRSPSTLSLENPSGTTMRTIESASPARKVSTWRSPIVPSNRPAGNNSFGCRLFMATARERSRSTKQTTV
jgi:hypothetical protein